MGRPASTIQYLLPFLALDFRKLVVVEIVLRVHIDDLGLGGCPQHLDDLDQVVNAALPDEQGHSVDHLQQDTPR